MQYGGYVCFVFTDIEGSTPLWEQHPAQMREAHQLHSHILSECTAEAGGRVFKTVGDAFCCAFPSVAQGLAAAEKIQEKITTAPWPANCPIRVRAAVHWGMPLVDGDDFQGPDVNLVARLLTQASAGQVLVSQAARDAQDGHELLFLGKAALRGIEQPVGVYQLGAETFAALPGLNQAPTNLRPRPTQLLGREDELARLTEATQASRCVSLVGPGGVGKTHLVTEFALSQRTNFPDGVWFVDFVELQSGADVEPFVLSLLCPKTTAPWDALRDKRLLVVLDNCEHVLDSARAFVRRMLAETPAQIITTTRELLGVPGERRFPVVPLKEAAVQLFRERCLEVNPELPLTLLDQYSPKIVAAFDGFPLAIVLAAALSASYPLHVLHEMVVSGKGVSAVVGTEHKRHSSVRATIEWSYNLLPLRDQEVLRRLTVFAGSADYTAIIFVTSFGEISESEASDSLVRLTRSSLLQLDAITGRYSMYVPVREYAQTAAQRVDTLPEAVSRHLAWVHNLTEEALPHLYGGDADLWMIKLEAEHPNIRLALSTSTNWEQKGWIVANLNQFWSRGPRLDEGLALTEGVSRRLQTTDSQLRCTVLSALGVLRWCRGKLDEASNAFHEALHFADSDRERAKIRVNLALVSYNLGQHQEALELLRAAERVYEHEGSEDLLTLVRSNIATLLHETGDLDGAMDLLARVIESADGMDRPSTAAAARRVLCECMLKRDGESPASLSLAYDALRIAVNLGDRLGASASCGLLLLHATLPSRSYYAGFWTASKADVRTSNPWLFAEIEGRRQETIDKLYFEAGKTDWLTGNLQRLAPSTE